MARISRKEILLDGSYYHVIARGNGNRKLFRCKMDYKIFINTTRDYLGKFEILIYHYCLMKNHVHFLIKAVDSLNLPKFMQRILQKYAVYFARKYESPGHIFQNRYKCYLIDKDTYLMECARYIERNPLKAKIVDNLLDYKWSSFNFYVKGTPDALIKNADPAYLEFGFSENERQKNYIKFVLESAPPQPIEK